MSNIEENENDVDEAAERIVNEMEIVCNIASEEAYAAGLRILERYGFEADQLMWLSVMRMSQLTSAMMLYEAMENGVSKEFAIGCLGETLDAIKLYKQEEE